MPLLRTRTAVALCGALALSACETLTVPSSPQSAGARGGAAAPSLGLFSRIKVPDDREPVLKLAARGAQVFRCEQRDGQGAWVFRQPDAELVDAAGKVVGRHGANFSFEHVDGSRLVATIAAHDEAPRPTDLRWLLMTTRSFGQGAFEGVTHVQRVDTSGGMPPASCDGAQSGRILRIEFTANFHFYRPRSASSQ